MTEPAPARNLAPSATLRAVGYVLATLGFLWTLLTGGCTLLFVAGSLGSMVTRSGDAGMLGLALMIGLPGILPGALMLWGGWALLRKTRATPPSS